MEAFACKPGNAKMGCGQSTDYGGGNEMNRTRDKEIEAQLKKEKKDLESTVKILVLGAGESGKSTLVKQMKIIHGDGYSSSELEDMGVSILENIRDSLCNMTNAMDTLAIEYDDPKTAELAKLFNDEDANTIVEQEDFSQEMIAASKKIWADKGIQRVYLRRNEYHLLDSCCYYLDDLDRIFSENFAPTVDDALRVRVRTTGILETKFKYENLIYKMIDVGGQRSERRKWLQCFDDVTAIIFVAALSGYDMILFEDANQNRLTESVDVFTNTFTNKVFAETNCILFLNKLDLFQAKVQTSPISNYHEEYEGYASEQGESKDDVTIGKEFICSLYENAFKRGTSMDTEKTRNIYTHYTTATDTNNIKLVFGVVNDFIVQLNLQQYGLI